MTEKIHFTKMQGIGSDFVYVNGFEQRVDDPPSLTQRISDRHCGVGSDGLVLILPSASADVRMRIFNADGIEDEMCGIAACCVGKYVRDHGLVLKDVISLETAAGIKVIRLKLDGGQVCGASVDMGEPVVVPSLIPVLCEPSLTTAEKDTRFIARPVEVDGRIWAVTAVSMGTPHAVIFAEHIDGLDIQHLGPLFEHHPIFPRRASICFVKVLASDKIQMRVWERGAGETRASGTGACAAAVASRLNGYSGRELTVEQPGGSLHIHWDSSDGHIYMTGPAETVFDGNYYL